ncbi:MAG: sulfotransferase domain-containing protein [Actinobacteria bacterium]|nr:sulfotransferase domain-containing protein [Actinomycetota bacterium]
MTLPNLLIAGVPKGGTTSLFRYLEQHPEICPASVKEIGYFSPLRSEGGVLPSTDSYSQHFDHCDKERYAMEATPAYSYGGVRMIQGIKTVLDRPRILIVLRNPVDRLWSAYTFQRTKGHLPGVSSFEDYVSICNDKRRKGEKQGPYFGGVTIGFYGEYLQDWFDLFERDVKILFADNLFTDPQTVVKDVCRWLSIDANPATDFDYDVRNKTAHARNITVSRAARTMKRTGGELLKRAPALEHVLRRTYVRLNTGDLEEKLSTETRRRLEDMYLPSNIKVAQLLKARGYGRLPSWLTLEPVRQQ